MIDEFGKAPENKLDFQPYDIYRKLTKKEKQAMANQIREDSVRFAAELDEKVLPQMPNTKHSTLQGKRNFLSIIAVREAKRIAQVKWLRASQEYYRQLQEEKERAKDESEGIYEQCGYSGVYQNRDTGGGSGTVGETYEIECEDPAGEELG